MPYNITKLTLKCFSLVLSAIFFMGLFLIVSAYQNAKTQTEEAERAKLQSMLNSAEIILEEPLKRYVQNSAHQAKQSLISLLNSINKATVTGGKVYLIVNGLGFTELHSGEVVLAKHSLATDKDFLETANTDLDPATEAIARFKSQTITVSKILDLSTGHGKLLAQKDLKPILTELLNFHIRLGLAALGALAIIAFLGIRTLKRITEQETASKRERESYIKTINARNAEMETFLFVLSQSDNLILLTDRFGKIEWINESNSRKNNYTSQELSGFVGKELVEVSQYPKIKEVIETVLLTKEKLEYEAKSYDVKNREYWGGTTVTPIIDAQGEVERMLFIDMDITRIKMAEKEIAKMASFTRENTKPAIRLNPEGEVLYANEAGASLLLHWTLPDGRCVQKGLILKTLKAAWNSHKDFKINIDCENRIYSIRFHPVESKGYINLYGEDITEVKQAEREIMKRSNQLEQFNLNITDSINYARRIQQAILPGEDEIRKCFKDSFVISRPKDIVSGDFFWVHELSQGQEYLIALADCTGHGVPGAMMSIIGHSLLNDIVGPRNISDPAKILAALNRELIKSLRQRKTTQSSDGMDVSLIRVDKAARMVTFAGAYQQAYWMNGKLNVLKGDRQPVGGIQHDPERSFTNHSFYIQEGDAIYLTTDGFADQFGGAENKKFLVSRLGELFKCNHRYSMQVQSNIFANAFDEWKGSEDQVDDVSILGFKF